MAEDYSSDTKTNGYSRFEVAGTILAGMVIGGIAGTIEGLIGAVAAPTMTRVVDNRLDDHINQVAREMKGDFYNGVFAASFSATRYTTLVTTAIPALYSACANLAEVIYHCDLNRFDAVSLLLVTNVIDLTYEIKRRKEKQQDSQAPTEN